MEEVSFPCSLIDTAPRSGWKGTWKLGNGHVMGGEYGAEDPRKIVRGAMLGD